MVDVTPGGYRSVTPHLVVSDGERAIQFYKRGLGAIELYQLRTRQGKIARAELAIGDCRLTLSDESPEWGARSARSYGGCSMSLRVYTQDVEALARSFLGAGGFVVEPLRDQAQGDRCGQFRDPEGYHWALAQRMEVVALEQLEQRVNALGLSLWRPRPSHPRGSRPRGR
jgi:PhnB protein